MRVLLDCRMSDWSGIGRYTRGLARALARADGVEIVQVVPIGAEPPVPDARAVRASAHPFSAGGGLQLAGLARGVAPDVMHCLHFPVPVPARHPLVVTLHDLSPLLVPGVMPSALNRAVFRHGVRHAMRVADRVVAISKHTAHDLRLELPAAAGKLRIVLEAAGDFTSGPVGELPAELAILARRPYVLSMGNTKPHKDLTTLLRAFAEASVRHPELSLLLVGADVPGFVASVLGSSPAASRVHFTGLVDDPALRRLYADAAAFAFPSRYEGFGLPPLEAMGLGTPVICSDAASLPEVVGEAALLVEAGDVHGFARALISVLDDAELSERLVEKGRARAAAFSWDKVAAETLAVYREVASGGNSLV